MGNIAILCSGGDDISHNNHAGGMVLSRKIAKMYNIVDRTEVCYG